MAARSSALAWALARAASALPDRRPHRSSSQLALRPSAWLLVVRAVVLPSWVAVPLRARVLLAVAPRLGRVAALALSSAARAARRRATARATFWLPLAARSCRASSAGSANRVHQAPGTLSCGWAICHTALPGAPSL